MQWGGRHEINLPEFPDVTFRWTYGEMMAVTGNEITSLYTGIPYLDFIYVRRITPRQKNIWTIFQNTIL